jgi:hypothetical protein
MNGLCMYADLHTYLINMNGTYMYVYRSTYISDTYEWIMYVDLHMYMITYVCRSLRRFTATHRRHSYAQTSFLRSVQFLKFEYFQKKLTIVFPFHEWHLSRDKIKPWMPRFSGAKVFSSFLMDQKPMFT